MGMYSKEELSFAVFGRDKTISLEANTEAERERWIAAISAWIEYHKALKQQNSKFSSR